MSVLDSTFGDGFPANYSWEMFQDDNAEAQKLLADALAANARMQTFGNSTRYEEGEKRKLKELAEDGGLSENSPVKSSHNEFRDSIYHDSEEESQDGKSDHGEAPKRTPKKPGRKPLANTPLTTSDPKQKRKAQNRAAQRAFRERKERYVKELEERIRELEASQSQSQLQAENTQLKSLVQKLETENYLLKGANFTFDFAVGKTVTAEPALNTRDPWTPPSSGDSDLGQNESEPTSPSDSGISGSPSSIQPSPGDAALSTFAEAQNSAAPVATADAADAVVVIADSPLQPIKDEITDHGIDQLLAEPLFSPLSYADVSSIPQATSPSTDKQAFTEYREPSPYHNPFSDSAPIPPLFENDFDDYGTFAPMLTPSLERTDEILAATPMGPVSIVPQQISVLSSSSSSSSSSSPAATALSPAQFAPTPARFSHTPTGSPAKGRMISFPKVWERISEHPKFDEFAVDQLCEEMMAKAKCSGHGPALEEEELNNVLKKLDGGS